MEVFFNTNDIYSMLKTQMKGHAVKYLVGVGVDHNNCPKAIFDIGKMAVDGWSLDEYVGVVTRARNMIWDWASKMYDEDTATEMELIGFDSRTNATEWVLHECDCDEWPDDGCPCSECDAECDCAGDCDGE